MNIEEMKNLRRENQKIKRNNQTAEDTKLYFDIISKCKRYIDDVIINVIKADGFKSYTDGEPTYIQSFGIKLSEWMSEYDNRDKLMSKFHQLVGKTVEEITEKKISELIEELGEIQYVKTSTMYSNLVIELEIHWI